MLNDLITISKENVCASYNRKMWFLLLKEQNSLTNLPLDVLSYSCLLQALLFVCHSLKGTKLFLAQCGGLHLHCKWLSFAAGGGKFNS